MHSFNLKDEEKFDPNKHVERVLGRVGEGDVTVACWEPGQTSPHHCHPHATEIYFCSEGGGPPSGWQPGNTTPHHFPPHATEIFFFCEGGGTMRTPPETVTVKPGSF